MERPDVEQFLVDEIDSVPHLEALLLLWRNAPRCFTAQKIAAQLYISHAQAREIAEGLHHRGLVARGGHHDAEFFYESQPEERARLMQELDEMYRLELIWISGIIHSKGSPGMLALLRKNRRSR